MITTSGARGWRSSPASAIFSVTTPEIGRGDRGVGNRFFEDGDLRGRYGQPRLGRFHFFAAGARAQPLNILRGRANALASGLGARLRRIPSRDRIVSLLARARVGREERFEPFDVLFGGVEIGGRGGDVRLGRGGLGLGLTNVLRASAGADESQLRVGLIAIGARAGERQFAVGGVELRNEGTGSDAIALGDGELQDTARYLRRHLHVGGFDLSGHADPIGRWLFPARAEQHRAEQQEYWTGGWGL